MNKIQHHFTRFAWAALASILLHLALIGNIFDPEWGLLFWPSTTVPTSLQIKLSPPAAIEPPRRSPKPLQPQPGIPLDNPIDNAELPSAQISAEPQPAASEPAPATPTPTSSEQSNDTATPQIPPSGQLIYKYYWGKDRWMAGQAIHQWTIENGHYTLSSIVNTTGLFKLIHPTRLIESAKGIIADGRLRPMEFSTQWNNDPPTVAAFDWNANILRWTRGKATFSQSLPSNSYDKISYLYQLYLTPVANRNLSAYITTGKLLESFDIRNMGVEEIEIDEKTYPAIHLKRAESASNRENIDIWLSTTLNNLPLKMIYSNNYGDHFEQLISSDTIKEASKQVR